MTANNLYKKEVPLHNYTMISFLHRKASAAIAFIVSLVIFALPLSAFSAQKITAGATCTSLNKKVTYQNKIYTCIKSGKKLIWNKGVSIKVAAPKPTPNPSSNQSQNSTPVAESSPTPIPTTSPTPSPSPQVQFPTEWTSCKKIGEKVMGPTSYMRCSWAGHANSLEEALNRSLVWKLFPIVTVSTSKSNNYSVIPKDGASCSNSGDTFDVSGGILECRWIYGKKLQWIKINSTKATFTNTKSPVSIDTCKLQLSASTADRTGRNAGGGIVGFPFEVNKNREPQMYLNGTNEVLIVPIDFPDFKGGPGVLEQLEYDKKWLVDWYNYFSDGKSKFNVTTINRWLTMPKAKTSYETNGKIGNALTNGNQVMGDQAQVFIDEISKEVDLRKFSTVYTFYPDGDYFLNDLIVRSHLFKIKEGEKHLNFFSWGRNLEGQETLKWSYYIHETLHDFNIIGHAPGNGWPLGIMATQSGISYAINPWEQFLFDWLPENQIYCDDAATLKTATLSLTPMEREDRQTKMAVIKLSKTKAIVVESHGIDKWSNIKFGDREFPPGFYSVMAYIVDLDKSVAAPAFADGSSPSNDDWAWAVWQKVDGGRSNEFNKTVGDNRNLGDYVAVLGDSFVIEGVRIKFVGTGDYETIEISKA